MLGFVCRAGTRAWPSYVPLRPCVQSQVRALCRVQLQRGQLRALHCSPGASRAKKGKAPRKRVIASKRGAESMKAKGTRLEMRVVRLFQRLGKYNVQRSVVVVDQHGNRSEIDVMYGFVFKTYVECKNYSGPVPLEAVAKFKAVLSLNGIPPSRGIFITSSYFVPRAKRLGIKTVDGEQLKEWERTATRTVWARRIAATWALCTVGYFAFGSDHELVQTVRSVFGLAPR